MQNVQNFNNEKPFEVQIFNNPDVGEIRSIDIDGEPWFVLKDVCTILELTNPAMVADRLENDEKGVSQIYTLGGIQEMTVINEYGLYSVLFRSDKPQAKLFRRWVIHDVIPSILRKGYYTDNRVLSGEVLEKRIENANLMIHEAKAKEADARQMQARAQLASLCKDFAENLNGEARSAAFAHAVNLAVGETVIPVPNIKEDELLRPVEVAIKIGELYGDHSVSSNIVSRTANEHGMKIDEYGRYYEKRLKCGSTKLEFCYYPHAVPEIWKNIQCDRSLRNLARG